MDLVVVFFVESGYGSVLGGIFVLAAIIALIVLGNTFWFDIGIGLGLSIAGIVFMIINCIIIKDLYESEKIKKIAYIEIALTILSLIIGLFFQLKLPKIEFSRIFGTFAQSLLISILIFIINEFISAFSFKDVGEFLLFPIMIAIWALVGICIGLAIMMLFYFTKNNNALNFFAKNLKYVNSEHIEERIREYGKDDIEYIIEQYTQKFIETELQEKKEYYSTSRYYENYTTEQKEERVLGDYLKFFNPDNGQYVGYAYDWKATTKANSNVKIISFTDCSVVACENGEYGFLRYYIKINIDDYTILGIQHEKFEDELAD